MGSVSTSCDEICLHLVHLPEFLSNWDITKRITRVKLGQAV